MFLFSRNTPLRNVGLITQQLVASVDFVIDLHFPNLACFLDSQPEKDYLHNLHALAYLSECLGT